MARPRIEYVPGQEIGEHGIIFIEEIEGYKTPSGAYERRVRVKCPKCGENFDSSLRRIVRKESRTKNPVEMCQNCAQKVTNERISNLGRQTIVDLTGQKFGKLTVLEMTDKRSQRTPIWKCLCECGNIVEISGSHLKNGHTQSCGCLKSKGESVISSLLRKQGIKFIQQKTFSDCYNPEKTSLLKFDFYLPEYNCCIEYDGEQHFRPVEHFGGQEKYERQKILDNIKNQYCENNGIKLIRIPYTDYDKIDSQYLNNLL